MKNNKYHIYFLIIIIGGFLFVPPPKQAYAAGNTYYIDATNGNDTNLGTSTDAAWKTILKVNASSFSPGDNIYFKRGEVWREQLTFPSSGSSGNPITIGDYGEGTKPTIYGSSLLNGTWTQYSGNIYNISLTTEAKTVLNGTSNLTLNEGNYGSLSNNQWDWYNNKLYVNIGLDPTGGNIEAGQRNLGIYCENKNYITIEDIIIRNTNNEGVRFDGTSNNIIVNNVESYSNANDGFKQYNTSNVTYNNIIGSYNLDDGFSLHDSAVATINTGTFNNNATGIDNITNSQIIADNITFSNNSPRNGLHIGGSAGGASIITNSSFSDNNDAAIYINESPSVIMSNITISGGTTGLGLGLGTSGAITVSNIIITNSDRGISLGGSGNISISDATITGGKYGLLGAGSISVADLSSFTISGQSINNIFWGTNSSGLTLSDSEIYNSSSTLVSISSASMTIENTKIHDAPASVNGIEVASGATLDIKYSLFYNIPANKFAMRVRSGGTAEIKNCVFYNNDNGIYIEDTTELYNSILTGHGVAVWFANTPNDLTLSHNDLWNNTTNFYGGTKENINGIASDPQFVNPSADFHLQSTSPAIDAGIPISGLTTDYAGNPIYGTPDIGAYEYQPPYTIGTDKINITGNIRIYNDGKYRYTTATSSVTEADLSVTPLGGFGESDYSKWMDVDIDIWDISDTYYKKWTETAIGTLSVAHTVGDLKANTYYTVKVDGTRYDTYLSDDSGKISFTYTGGYSDHEFEVEEDTAPPTSFDLSSPYDNTSTNDTTPTFNWNASIDAESELAKYQLYIDGNLDKDDISSSTTSAIPNQSLFCGSHTWYVKAVDNAGNSIRSDSTYTINVVCGFTPGQPITKKPISEMTAAEIRAKITEITEAILQLKLLLAETEKTKKTYEGIPSDFTLDKNLEYGQTSDEIKYLQIILKQEVGPPTYPENVPATGWFGPITKNSVIEFQEKYASDILAPWNLTKGTGYIGRTTLAKLNELLKR